MSSKVTLRSVAREAQVAESTVSRALHGGGQLADATRARIIEAAERLGYQVPTKSRAGEGHASGRRGVIGVVVGALHNSFYPFLLDRLHNELDDLGYDMVLVIDEISGDRAGQKLRALVDTLDGVIITTATIGSPTVEFLANRSVPTVLAIRSDLTGKTHVVESDNFAAGAEAMQHLTALGHRRIGLLVGPESTSTSKGRVEGARSVVEGMGIKPNETMLYRTDFTHEGGYSGCVQMLRSENPPTAVFCANDVIAIGALDAARKMGLDVPRDLSIIGVDDIPMASWSMISLTTVRQPIGDIGTMAAKLIAEVVEGSSAAEPRQHIFPTNLVVRATTGPVV